MSIKENLQNIRQEIKNTCENCGRDPKQVKLIAVSKKKPDSDILKAFEAGQFQFGENNAVEAKEKSINLQNIKEIEWHMIGSLQTNKVKYVTGFCKLLHSLDRKSLADKLQERLEFEDKTLDCLLQINISDEKSKSGVKKGDYLDFIKYVSKLDRIKIKGLMSMAENTLNKKIIRKNFRDLKSIFEDIRSQNIPHIDMEELSMGMSGDYKIAIEEGATMIRIGSAIFGERKNGH